MLQVNIFEAKTDLSKLVRLVEDGSEDSICICRYNKPVARLVPYESTDKASRIGIAKGKLTSPDDFDADNEEIAGMFGIPS